MYFTKGKSQFAGEFLLYNADPKTQLYRAYDNITNFIKWCRFIVKVRECLMFDTEDLILCKNEKNFILCLLEVARFGSRFGIQVPTIIRLEQEIEAEIAMESKRILEEKYADIQEANEDDTDKVLISSGAEIVEEVFAEAGIKEKIEVVEEVISDLDVQDEDSKNSLIENDSLNKTNSFMDDFIPIEGNENMCDQNGDNSESNKLEWSRTSSSGCLNDDLTENSNKNGKLKQIIFNETLLL